MEQREALQEAVLQLFQLLTEHHAFARTVAIEQEEAAFGLARQHALHNREDRRDAAAGGKTDIGPRPRTKTRRHPPSSRRYGARRHRDRSRSNRSAAPPRHPWWCGA